MFKKLLVMLVMVGFMFGSNAMADTAPQFLSFYGSHSQCFMTMQNYYANNTFPKWICSGIIVKKERMTKPVVIIEKEQFVVHFDFDSAKIKTDQISVLKRASSYIMKMKPEHVKLEAFCDFRGTDKYNMVLGKKRLDSIKRWLESNGVSKSFILINNGKRKSPVRPLKGKFCKKCWEDRKVEIDVE